MADQPSNAPEDLYLGTTAEPTPRVKAALEELALAFSEQETSEVEGYTFGSDMSLGLSPAGANQIFGVKIGVSSGPIDGGDRCTGEGASFVKCRRVYNAAADLVG